MPVTSYSSGGASKSPKVANQKGVPFTEINLHGVVHMTFTIASAAPMPFNTHRRTLFLGRFSTARQSAIGTMRAGFDPHSALVGAHSLRLWGLVR